MNDKAICHGAVWAQKRPGYWEYRPCSKDPKTVLKTEAGRLDFCGIHARALNRKGWLPAFVNGWRTTVHL